MTKELTHMELPIKNPNPEIKAGIFETAREGYFPVINLKVAKEGKGEGCPYNCSYCDVGGSEGISSKLLKQFPEKGYWQETEESDFNFFLESWAKQGGKVFHCCGDGEPTTFKWFDNILDLSDKYGFKIEIFSTLAGLTPQRMEQLIERESTIKFKLDSLNPTTLGEIMNKDIHNYENSTKKGIFVLNQIDKLIEIRDKFQNKSQLIAGIVMTDKNKNDLNEILEWCCKFNIVPQINYMEDFGMAKETDVKGLNEEEIKNINNLLKTRFNIDNPKQIMGDQCEAKAAPIIVGNKVYLGPFGMGCEFVLREHMGTLNFIGEYKKDINELKDPIKAFRFSETNLTAVIQELTNIKEGKGIYSKTGTDEILPGCGDDIEELWLLEYAATIFTSDEYFNNFINNRVLKGEHRKWTKEEIDTLINQIELRLPNNQTTLSSIN